MLSRLMTVTLFDVKKGQVEWTILSLVLGSTKNLYEPLDNSSNFEFIASARKSGFTVGVRSIITIYTPRMFHGSLTLQSLLRRTRRRHAPPSAQHAITNHQKL